MSNDAVSQSQAELEAHLSEQVGFLRSSASTFDSGVVSEAKRIASTLRLLLHDTRKSKSLLGQLGLKDIGFFDTAKAIDAQNLLTESALVAMKFSPTGSPEWMAPLSNSPRGPGKPVAFAVWWHQCIFRDVRRETLSRAELVLTMADQDGGAHVDPTLERKYALLTRANSLGWSEIHPSQERPMAAPHFAAIRQIAHEVLTSLELRVAPITE